MLVGYRTRLAVIALWLLITFLHVRNPVLLNAGDTTVRLLLFWSMFLPIGMQWSFDKALATNSRFLPKHALSFGTAGIQIQVAIIYFFTWLLKTGFAWQNGSAIEMALRNNRLATPLADVLLAYPAMLNFLTHGVFWFELIAALLLFWPIGTSKIRALAVPALMLMHIGFGMFLHIGLFPVISIVSLLVFIPSTAWDSWTALARGGNGMTIYYDGGCSFCRRMVSILKTFLVLPQAQVKEAQSDPKVLHIMLEQNSWVVEDATGKRATHGNGLKAVVAGSPLLSPLRWFWLLPPFASLVDASYKWVARNRPTAGQAFRFLPMRALPRRANAITQGIAAISLLYVLAWNITDAVGLPKPIESVAHALQIQQRWSMFSPQPPGETGWLVMAGITKDGRHINLLAALKGDNHQEASLRPPENYPAAFKNYRWNKYLSRTTGTASPLIAPLVSHLCNHIPEVNLNQISITYMYHRTDFAIEPRPRLLAEIDCVPVAH